MMIGICNYCKKEFRKREQKRQFCSRFCSNRFNKNGLIEVKLPEHNQDLAEFTGICLGDGCAWGYQVSITLHKDWDSSYIPYVTSLARRLFPNASVAHVKRKDKAIDIRISSKAITDFMKDQGIISNNKKVPKWILTDSVYIKSCIRGLIDTDGSFIWHKYKVKDKEYKYPKLSFTNRSKDLLDFVYAGLKGLGLNPKATYKYQIWLHSQSQVVNYLRLIGTRNMKANIIKISKYKTISIN